jgi:hypothetical protein
VIELSSLLIRSFQVLLTWVSCLETFDLPQPSKVKKVSHITHRFTRLSFTNAFVRNPFQSVLSLELDSIWLLLPLLRSLSMDSLTSELVKPVPIVSVFFSPNSWLDRTRFFKLPELMSFPRLNLTLPWSGYHQLSGLLLSTLCYPERNSILSLQ